MRRLRRRLLNRSREPSKRFVDVPIGEEYLNIILSRFCQGYRKFPSGIQAEVVEAFVEARQQRADDPRASALEQRWATRWLWRARTTGCGRRALESLPVELEHDECWLHRVNGLRHELCRLFGHVCSANDVDLAIAIAPHGDGVVAGGRYRDGGHGSRTQRCSSSNGPEVSPFQDALLAVERADECDMAEDQAHFYF